MRGAGVRRNQEPPFSSAISEVGNLWSSSESKMGSIGLSTSPPYKGGS
jgi:hypothetical protein